MGSRVLSRSFTVRPWHGTNGDGEHGAATNEDVDEDAEYRSPTPTPMNRDQIADDVPAKSPSLNPDEDEDSDEEEEEEDPADVAMVPMADMLNAQFAISNVGLRVHSHEPRVHTAFTRPTSSMNLLNCA
jgi:N-lysine methyltransferase SETD6